MKVELTEEDQAIFARNVARGIAASLPLDATLHWALDLRATRDWMRGAKYLPPHWRLTSHLVPNYRGKR